MWGPRLTAALVASAVGSALVAAAWRVVALPCAARLGARFPALIDGVPLAPNDVAPGWNWFHRSHEALLGRASEHALANGRTSLVLGVLRAGKVEQLELALPRQSPFTTLDPATDPAAAEMLGELIVWIRDNQHADGSWSRDIKRTTFAALALISHDLELHREAIARAIDWSLQQYDTPEKHGNLGFWGGAFMGILYAEWHLHTGDGRAVDKVSHIFIGGGFQCFKISHIALDKFDIWMLA
jgi:hypothetical protein